MKVAVVFLVMAVSSCSGIIGVPGVNPGGVIEVPNLCLLKILTSTKDLLLRLATIICKHDHLLEKQSELTDEDWKGLYDGLEATLESVDCTVFDLLGISVWDSLGGTTADVVNTLIGTLRPVLESELGDTGLQALCDLVGKFLDADCLPSLVGDDIPTFVINLKTKVCTGNYRELAREDLTKIVERATCLLKNGPLAGFNLDEVVRGITQAENGLLDVTDLAKEVLDIIVAVLCPLVDQIIPIP